MRASILPDDNLSNTQKRKSSEAGPTVEIHPLPFDNMGWKSGKHASGSQCIFVRQARNTTEPNDLRHMLQEVRDFESSQNIPMSRRLFPCGQLKSRACYLLNLGLMSSRFELRVRSGRASEAASRCKEAQITSADSEGLVFWRATASLLIDASCPLGLSALLSEDHSSDSSKAVSERLSEINITNAAELLRATGINELGDDDFFAIENKQEELTSKLRSALHTIVAMAKAEDAVLIYPDYSLYDAPVMFSKILEASDFSGPLLAIGADESSIAECIGPIDKPDNWGRVNKKYVTMPGATHAFLIAGEYGFADEKYTTDHCRLSAALAVAISGRTETRHILDDAHKRTLCGVLSNGGKGCLKMVGEGVRQGVPYLILEGSGRLSDYLPEAYLQRSSQIFNPFVASTEIIKSCGFDAVDLSDGAELETILSGNLTIHQLANGRHPLQRLLFSCFIGKDNALQEALSRRSEYLAAHTRLNRPDRWLHLTYLAGTILLTVLATVLSQLTYNSDDDIGTSGGCNLASGNCHPLQYVVTVLPVTLSILLSLRIDLDYERSAKTLRYAAALVDRVIWEYITHSGSYADLATMKVSDGISASVLDTQSVRAQELTNQLVKISRQYLGDAPNWIGNDSRDSTDEPTTLLLVSSVSADSRGSEYVRHRVEEQKKHWSAEGRRAKNMLILFKVLSYTIGAVGTILALLGWEAWVTVTTSVMAALAAWNYVSPVEERFRHASAASQSLNNILLQWEAVPTECRGYQTVIDRLVDRAESAILDAIEPPAAMDIAMRDEKLPLWSL